ncbi:MAG: hydroxymethylbilane synthase [Candidatus Hydrogenedentota bacterium]
MRLKLTIGSRGSKLALTQTNQVADMIRAAIAGVEVDITIITTKGDRILDKPLAEIGGKGLFTEELEMALRDGSIDLAVHSLKDLPTDDPEGLCIAATPKRVTPNDALVCTKYASLKELPAGATVGTSSLRRRAQLLSINSELNIVDIRGNIDTRMGKVIETGELDAVILACAGLERIDRGDVIAQVIPSDLMLPAASQGVLGIQTRSDDTELRDALSSIHNTPTYAEATAERTLLARLGGGCQVPIGALAKVDGDTLTLEACVCSLDGKTTLRATVSGAIDDAEPLGQQAALDLLSLGANAIIAEIV